MSIQDLRDVKIITAMITLSKKMVRLILKFYRID